MSHLGSFNYSVFVFVFVFVTVKGIAISLFVLEIVNLTLCRLWVYNAEKKIVGSGTYFAPVVKLHTKIQKRIILGHPSVNIKIDIAINVCVCKYLNRY